VVAGHGYNCYYLNMLAGSAQSLTASDDPDFAWVKNTWTSRIRASRWFIWEWKNRYVVTSQSCERFWEVTTQKIGEGYVWAV
jgi:hypothetical protein